MKKIKVFSYKNLPVKLPFNTTTVAYLVMDNYHPAGWVWGAVSTILVILWVMIIYAKCNQEEVDVMEGL